MQELLDKCLLERMTGRTRAKEPRLRALYSSCPYWTRLVRLLVFFTGETLRFEYGEDLETRKTGGRWIRGRPNRPLQDKPLSNYLY